MTLGKSLSSSIRGERWCVRSARKKNHERYQISRCNTVAMAFPRKQGKGIFPRIFTKLIKFISTRSPGTYSMKKIFPRNLRIQWRSECSSPLFDIDKQGNVVGTYRRTYRSNWMITSSSGSTIIIISRYWLPEGTFYQLCQYSSFKNRFRSTFHFPLFFCMRTWFPD